MKRTLFVFAKLNPGLKYVQGMNELHAPLLWTFRTDPDEAESEHAEADAFFCFMEIMSEFRDHFCKQLKTHECLLPCRNATSGPLPCHTGPDTPNGRGTVDAPVGSGPSAAPGGSGPSRALPGGILTHVPGASTASCVYCVGSSGSWIAADSPGIPTAPTP